MTEHKGTMVYDEKIFPIVDIRLEEGTILLVGYIERTTDSHPGGITDVEFFGTDGISLGSLRMHVPAWSAVEGSVTILQPIHFTEMFASASRGKGKVRRR